jgi:hypothetical protein
MNRIELETLMKTPSDTLVPWGDGGKVITVAEALKRVFQGEGAEIAPVPPQPAQPSHQGGPNIRISQQSADQLSEANYRELERTGHIAGLTKRDDRTFVHVSRGGSHSVSLTLDEKGAVGPGRPMDLRDFDRSAGS